MGVMRLSTLAAGTVAVGIDLIIRDSSNTPRAAGSVTYKNIFGTPTSENVNIVSHISNTSATWQGAAATPFNFSFEGSEPVSPPNCYQAFITAVADDSTAEGHSNAICVQGPPPPDPPPPGGGGCDGRMLNVAEDCSPIVINFENGDYRLTGRNSPVLFDMRGNGHPLLMGWTAAGADEAFLWLDRNHNGKVTSGAELFGNFTPLKNGRMAINGFEALAEFDANRDGIIDDRDPIWSRLMLWRDLNHNALSESSEVSPLDASDVTAIDLDDHWTGRHDQWGNAFRYKSLISIRNRSGHAVRKQPVYDIFFVSVSQ
jgi:hypothetical protein